MFSHNTTEEPENSMDLMAFMCCLFVYFVVFRANCVGGIDDMIMDFKFVWITELTNFSWTLILC